ncbi:FAD binding domain-containing protein [Nakamurella leprariae]|uniref:Xanthine dehydrogenase family protein subunit M n=1 Tax=Nakamurella leprariae TaxID=2803911 RepID=A0A938YEQ7_9ACTN|nr:xanthine dehydrogenase family protein subunit M [Nakamurella leprariae]MBM9468238.1 xanthine dehydrogenase family protein subunit M [Nakamurella leprariae]
MIPASFDYVRAGSIDEAVSLLGEHGDDAKLLAGGHSLLPMMKLRLAVPETLIDIRHLREASYIRVDGDEVAIGGLTRHRDLVTSEVLRAEAPLIGLVAGHVGDPQIRHRGTIGGSLAHADPAADLPAAVLASGATLVAQGAAGRRTIAVDDFFLGFFETALEPDEVLVEIRVLRTGPTGAHYEKFTRRANDWAIVAVATVAGRVALANMGGRPTRATATEQALAEGASIEDAAALAADGTEPVQDMHADPDYRRHLARVLTRRSLAAAAA